MAVISAAKHVLVAELLKEGELALKLGWVNSITVYLCKVESGCWNEKFSEQYMGSAWKTQKISTNSSHLFDAGKACGIRRLEGLKQ